MTSRKKIFKPIVYSFLGVAVTLITVLAVSNYGLNTEQKEVKQFTSNSLTTVPKEEGVVKFVSGSLTSTKTVPIGCGGDTKFLIFGKYYNTTNRIVGLRSQDTTFTLKNNNSNFTIKPFDDECVNYVTKQNYLYPNTSTKGYFEIVNKSDSAGNVEISLDDEIEVNFDTVIDTDKKVEDRLNLETSSTDTPVEEKTTDKPSFVVQNTPSDIDDSSQKIILGGLAFLVLCPIALLLGQIVYKRKKRKDKTN